MGSRLSPEEVAHRYGGEAKYYNDEHHHIPQNNQSILPTNHRSLPRVVGKGYGNNPFYFKGCGDDFPVVKVCWDMAKLASFC